MDWLRSTYFATMRLSTSPLLEVPIMWYHVPEDRPLAPDPQSFRSQVNRPFHFDYPDIGEVDTGLYPWSSGAELGPVPFGPVIGTSAQWLSGV